eukprot:TRINITY_DN61635_c0_g1_i1.p2 TRINITY_DN61635_c0_g1~~TRINITY_DN61635_c0_g1_i1.p2  ORF type:complete len:112 (+),score=22.56 TRINITY_DN61635_c0_g1_i1:105-440(+)
MCIRDRLYLFTVSGSSSSILLAGLGGGMVGFMIQTAVLSVLTTSVGTLYVCVALDPAVLRVKNPEYFKRVQACWYARWGETGSHQVHLETRNRAYHQPPQYNPNDLDGLGK